MKQKTIKKPVVINGIGLHSGKNTKMEVFPAGENFGVKFIRMDVSPNECIDAYYNNVQNTMLATSVVHNGIEVKTIEHFFSALFGLGIDNVLVRVYGPEIPILDGSSQVFIDKLLESGIETQSEDRVYIKILKEVTIKDEDKVATLKPYEGTKFEFEIDYKNDYIDATPSYAVYEMGINDFVEDVSKARTFGFEKEINYLKKENLIMGGSLENAIVVGDNNILNEGGLRTKDEFVKHKILDAIGDIYLLNHQIIGAYYGVKSGHRLNNKLLRKLMNDESNFEFVTKVK